MDKKELINEIMTNDQVRIAWDKNWRWFHNGDDENSCPLLKFMLNIEYRSGTLLFVPDKINQCKMVDRNKD